MTDEMERQAEEIFSHLEDLGNGSILEGTYEGIENGYFVGEIADAAYRFEREVNAGQRIIVGVNEFTEGDDPDGRNLLRISAETEDYQLKRLQDIKLRRNQKDVDLSLKEITEVASDPARNLMPAIIDAVKVYATEEEISDSMTKEFGTYVEKAIV